MNITESPIIIRDIRGLSEMIAVEDLQREVWGISEREIFPALALIPMCEVGAILIGAFHGEVLVGFVFGFPGIEEGKPIIHSDMLAVKKEYRSQKLGYRLKLAQRESALLKGIQKITWTFDPLQSVNAHLNFAKLGVVSDRYEVDYYGQTSSPLHRFGTDRLWVTWMIQSDHVRQRMELSEDSKPPEIEAWPVLLEVSADYEPEIHPESLSQHELLIKIPGSIDSLKTRGGDELLHRWRRATRHAFVESMKGEFVVEDFHIRANEGCYLLRKKFRSSNLSAND